jgi:hypothetical protein
MYFEQVDEDHELSGFRWVNLHEFLLESYGISKNR